ncbi:MAG: maleylpyruvate isomerase family mycothiol-dependent enzyme [Ilumatobacteraceae bacterium]
MIPHDTIDTLAQCWSSLDELIATLAEREWKAPTDLPGWTVQDNLSHLIGTERMLQGLPATTHRSEPRAYVKNPIGEMNEHEIDARRALSGAEVASEWRELSDARLRTLRSADDAYFQQPAMTPTGPGTVADFLHIRVLDSWLHEQDMRRAADRPGNLAGPAAELTVDRLIRTIPIVVGKRAATPEGGAVALNISGGVERHLLCEVRNGRAAMVETPTHAPLATIALDTEGFVVLAAGRRGPERITATISGDGELAGRVLGQFNMMI